MQRFGPQPGAFEIEEDDEKVTFRMNPCGSGQRLWRMGRYEGEDGHAVMEEEHDWAYDRKGFPIYCTHCTFMNEILPIHWIGYPVYPSDPPGTSITIPAPGTGTRTRPTSPTATGSAMGSSGASELLRPPAGA